MAKVTANLDKKRELKFTMLAWEYLANKYGSAPKAISKFQSISGSDLSGEAITAIIDFVVAACVHEDPEVDRNAIANSMTFDNMKDVAGKLAEAIQASLPKQNDDTEAVSTDPQ